MSEQMNDYFDIDKWLSGYARQKKLALCMWYDIIVALQHEDYVDILDHKYTFAEKHGLDWLDNCFLCQMFMRIIENKVTCTECPLEKKYKGQAKYGCSLKEGITPYARVTNKELSKEERIAAAWEIVEAIKSL